MRKTSIAWNASGSLRFSEAEITLLKLGTCQLLMSVYCVPWHRNPFQCSRGFPCGKRHGALADNQCRVQGYQAAPRAKCLSTSRPSPTPTPSQTAVRVGMRTFL